MSKEQKDNRNQQSDSKSNPEHTGNGNRRDVDNPDNPTANQNRQKEERTDGKRKEEESTSKKGQNAKLGSVNK